MSEKTNLDPKELPLLLTLEQTSELLCVHRNTLRNWDAEGVLRARRIGSRGDRRYERDTILRILKAANGDAATILALPRRLVETVEAVRDRIVRSKLNAVVDHEPSWSKRGLIRRLPVRLPSIPRIPARPALAALAVILLAAAAVPLIVFRNSSSVNRSQVVERSTSSVAPPPLTDQELIALESNVFPVVTNPSAAGDVLGESTEPSPVEPDPASVAVAEEPQAEEPASSDDAAEVKAIAASTLPSTSSASGTGLFFAGVSFFFGIIFFAYALKYYGTLAIVLAFSRNVEGGGGFVNGNGYKNGNGNGNGYKNGNGNGHHNGNGKPPGLFRSIFSNGNGNGNGYKPAKGGSGSAGNGNGHHNGNGNGNGERKIFRSRYLASYSNGNGNGHTPGGAARLPDGQGSGSAGNGNGNGNGNGKGFASKFFGFFFGNGNGNGNGHTPGGAGSGSAGNGNGNGNANGHTNGNGYVNGNGNGYHNGNGGSFLSRLLFGSRPEKNGKSRVGMLPNVEHIDVERQPFISVHLPFYNEKKVANRILTAATSFDYANYEVIVVDDSTDETREILKAWAKHPKVRVIHRENREGFKGGALRVAMEAMNPKTEFVAVFDADFVPYPDSLLQFLRYFHVTNGEVNGHAPANDIAAVQGYQWHVLNKNENWITRAVRAEFAGSYVVERPGHEILGAMKQIAGSVFMVRSDLLKRYGWRTSITEDFELTIRLAVDGYRVVYTPYIQGPSECVASFRRLIRQRMRWAEGHTRIIRKYFFEVLTSPKLRTREKVEFLFLAPYYLQATFFLIGSLSWFVADAVLHTSLPFWTALWGWSLLFTNMLALPLVNSVGLFLEESPRRDYVGIFSFIALSYAIVPFQAYAALRGLFKKDESPWFRTPKTGHITDAFFRSRFRRWFGILQPARVPVRSERSGATDYLKLLTSHNTFRASRFVPKTLPFMLRTGLVAILIVATFVLGVFGYQVPLVQAAPGTQIKTVEFFIFQYDSATPISSGNGICSTAGGCTYDSTCAGSGISFTIDLPESGTITVRRAYVEWRFHDDNAGNTITSGEMKFCRSGQTARLQTLGSHQVADTAEDNQIVYRMEAQDTGASNGGQIIAGSNTYKFDARVTGSAWNTDSVKMVITYEYDDTAATQLKTVRYFLDQNAAQTAADTNDDVVINPQITEGGVTVVSNWVEMGGDFSIATNAELEMQASIANSATCAASTSSGFLEGAPDSNRGFVIMDDFSNTGFNLNANNCIRIRNATQALNAKQAEWVITYKYSYYSAAEADDTTHLKTVKYFIGNQQTSINVGPEQIGALAVSLPETSISFKSVWIRYYYSYDAADTFTGSLTNDGCAASIGNPSPFTDTGPAVVISNGGQESGGVTSLFDVTSRFTSTWPAGGESWQVCADAVDASDIWGTSAEYVMTYRYDAKASTTGIKTVDWWVGSRSARGTGDFTEATEGATTPMGIPFSTFVPEGGTKTERSAAMFADIEVAAAPTTSSTNVITRSTDTCSVNYLATAALNFNRQHGCDIAPAVDWTVAQADLTFTVTGAGAVNELEAPVAYTTYETTVPAAPEYVLIFLLLAPFIPWFMRLMERRRLRSVSQRLSDPASRNRSERDIQLKDHGP